MQRKNGCRRTGHAPLVHQRGADRSGRRLFAFAALFLGVTALTFGQTDPWSNAATRLGTAFTGPIAKGFALVAIVVGGLQLAFSEGGGRRTVGGLIFGLGLALGAANFVTWLFS